MSEAPRVSGHDWLKLSDSQLLAQCEIDLYRASGPGGQKRNKTSSAVRLRHAPTGLIVTAVESRSQHENRARAIRRMRRAFALHVRTALPADAPVPEFYKAAIARDPSLHVNPRHPDYLAVIQYVLDLLAVEQASVSQTAARLSISTGQLVRFLKDDEDAWQQANEIRKRFGLTTLR